MTAQPLDLEKPESEVVIRQINNLKNHSFMDIIKARLAMTPFVEIFTYIISFVILIPYFYLLYKGNNISQVYDTIAKITFGAYISKFIKM
jgi:hypothetical protein